MSNSQALKNSSSQREVDEYARLQTLLRERNTSLQAAERLNENYKTAAKHAQFNMRLLMALCVACILLISLGGDV